MTRKQKILVPVTIAALVLGLAAAAAAVDEEHAETFAFAAGGRVSLDNVNGDVEITAWDSAEVKVEYTKRARTQEGLDRMEVSIDASANRIHVETDYRDSGRRWGADSSGEVDYRLWVPRDARLDEIELVNGRLEVRGVSGDVAASLVNGDLIAEGLAGDLELETVNGSIEVAMVELAPDKQVTIESVNGRIELVLPRGAGADIQAETVHGKIRNDFGLDEKRERYGVGRSLRGSVGGGGAGIELDNVNGSISIRSQ